MENESGDSEFGAFVTAGEECSGLCLGLGLREEMARGIIGSDGRGMESATKREVWIAREGGVRDEKEG